jgi:hypothetical protein
MFPTVMHGTPPFNWPSPSATSIGWRHGTERSAELLFRDGHVINLAPIKAGLSTLNDVRWKTVDSARYFTWLPGENPSRSYDSTYNFQNYDLGIVDYAGRVPRWKKAKDDATGYKQLGIDNNLHPMGYPEELSGPGGPRRRLAQPAQRPGRSPTRKPMSTGSRQLLLLGIVIVGFRPRVFHLGRKSGPSIAKEFTETGVCLSCKAEGEVTYPRAEARTSLPEVRNAGVLSVLLLFRVQNDLRAGGSSSAAGEPAAPLGVACTTCGSNCHAVPAESAGVRAGGGYAAAEVAVRSGRPSGRPTVETEARPLSKLARRYARHYEHLVRLVKSTSTIFRRTSSSPDRSVRAGKADPRPAGPCRRSSRTSACRGAAAGPSARTRARRSSTSGTRRLVAAGPARAGE